MIFGTGKFPLTHTLADGTETVVRTPTAGLSWRSKTDGVEHTFCELNIGGNKPAFLKACKYLLLGRNKDRGYDMSAEDHLASVNADEVSLRWTINDKLTSLISARTNIDQLHPEPELQ